MQNQDPQSILECGSTFPVSNVSINASQISIDSVVLEVTPTEWPRQQLLSTLLIGLATLALLAYLYNDYKQFIALGPGGTPSTVLGYTRVKMLSVCAIREPHQPDQRIRCYEGGYLTSLPARGERPVVRGIAPQRQMTQRASIILQRRLNNLLHEMARGSDDLKMGISYFEKHGEALFSTVLTRITDHGEICHVHFLDGAMHVTLHPADLKMVLKSAWGERHPLARGGHFKCFVPDTFTLIYAPRDVDDFKILTEIIRASTWYVSGKKLIPEKVLQQMTC